MPKFTCTIKASITLVKEVEDTIEIESPDEVQAEEDALTAAEHIDSKYWLSNLRHSIVDTYEEIDFELINTEEKEEKNDEYTD
jgi:hypothetical protein